jgi:MFS family permease
MRIIVISVIAMLLQQALATMAPLSIAVIGPVVTEFLNINPGYIGAFVAMTYGTSMVSSLLSGGAIARYGAMRVSQCALIFCGLGLAVAATGSVPMFILAAVLLGMGGGPSTPASSHILARFSPPHVLPLVFSIKQTGVPVGGILAGALIPFWLLRGRLDDDKDPGRALSLRGSAETFRNVVGNPALREIALAHFLFTGLQLTYGSFFVAFLVDGNGLDLVFAGLAFACGQGAGIFGRIFWGWVASGRTSPRLILGVLGLGMGLVGCILALMGPDWSSWAIVLTALAFGLTGMSFQGVLLSEIARRAPAGSVGDVTGVVVVFAYAGMVLFPGAVGAIVGLTGSYAAGFLFSAVATMPISIMLVRKASK